MLAILMLSFALRETVLTADPQSLAKDAWMECGRVARNAFQIQECQLGYMGKLTSSAEPDTEHGRRVGAIVAARRAEIEAAEAKRREPVERTQGDVNGQAAQVERGELGQEETERLLVTLQEAPGAMRLAWSTVICRWTAIRADAKREIEQERKYAREGAGIVNKASLYAEQQRMRRADERMDRARRELHEFDTDPRSRARTRASSPPWSV